MKHKQKACLTLAICGQAEDLPRHQLVWRTKSVDCADCKTRMRVFEQKAQDNFRKATNAS